MTNEEKIALLQCQVEDLCIMVLVMQKAINENAGMLEEVCITEPYRVEKEDGVWRAETNEQKRLRQRTALLGSKAQLKKGKKKR